MPRFHDEKLPLGEHLAALRKTLIISIAAVAIGFVLVFYFAIDGLMSLLTQPILARGIEIVYTAVAEGLTTKLKVALVDGIVLASPVIIWEVWQFIGPALYQNEKRMVQRLFFVMVLLFLLGVSFCYGAVYWLTVDFFLVSSENLATPMLSIDSYVDFLFGFIIPFGLAFELPVALYITTKAGLTTYRSLAAKRKYVILAVAIVAAILTPPDVVSQIMLGIPMLLLFEAGLAVCRFVKPKETT